MENPIKAKVKNHLLASLKKLDNTDTNDPLRYLKQIKQYSWRKIEGMLDASIDYYLWDQIEKELYTEYTNQYLSEINDANRYNYMLLLKAFVNDTKFKKLYLLQQIGDVETLLSIANEEIKTPVDVCVGMEVFDVLVNCYYTYEQHQPQIEKFFRNALKKATNKAKERSVMECDAFELGNILGDPYRFGYNVLSKEVLKSLDYPVFHDEYKQQYRQINEEYPDVADFKKAHLAFVKALHLVPEDVRYNAIHNGLLMLVQKDNFEKSLNADVYVAICKGIVQLPDTIKNDLCDEVFKAYTLLSHKESSYSSNQSSGNLAILLTMFNKPFDAKVLKNAITITAKYYQESKYVFQTRYAYWFMKNDGKAALEYLNSLDTYEHTEYLIALFADLNYKEALPTIEKLKNNNTNPILTEVIKESITRLNIQNEAPAPEHRMAMMLGIQSPGQRAVGAENDNVFVQLAKEKLEIDDTVYETDQE